MNGLEFLKGAGRSKVQSLYVLHGDEDFLKRQVLLGLRALVFGPQGNEFGFSTQAGDKATFASVRDELETVPFLSPRRLVVVENADPFVTRYRAALEKYQEQPAQTGVLVLEVKSFPATTRLAKMVGTAGNIECKAPPAYRLWQWCITWAASRHGKGLTEPAARLLVDLVGTEMGVLDQELAKLAIYAGKAPRIEVDDVDQLVGRSRTQITFKIFDALAVGRPQEAFTILDRLFDQGEEPLAILGAFSWQLRLLAKAARLNQQGLGFAATAERAGIPPFARQPVEQQLRRLGPKRADQLYDWLLEVDLGIKGASQLSPRLLLERLVIRLAGKE